VRALRGDRHGVLVGMTPLGARVWPADSDASVEHVAHVFAESALTTLTRLGFLVARLSPTDDCSSYLATDYIPRS
jgi:hypothetical protein